MKVTFIPILICALDTFYKRIGKRNKELGNKRTNGDHPNYSIIEIGPNTEKSPGDLRKFFDIQTSVKNHQLPLM